MSLVNVGLTNISIVDVSFEDDDPQLLWLGVIDINNSRSVKKLCKKLILVTWHYGIQQDGGIVACQHMQKRNRTIFY